MTESAKTVPNVPTSPSGATPVRWRARLLLALWLAWVLALAWLSHERWSKARPEMPSAPVPASGEMR